MRWKRRRVTPPQLWNRSLISWMHHFTVCVLVLVWFVFGRLVLVSVVSKCCSGSLKGHGAPEPIGGPLAPPEGAGE